jgi:enoyl-CoA hydratase/carnithine racemase
MSLRLERDGPIGRIMIDRPEKRNAFNQEMWEQFPVLLGAALIDRAIRVVVVQSAAQGVFCAGADINELISHKDNTAWRAANQAAINRTQHELARFAKPTIAFIDGDCVGGGCGIALACDIRVATAGSRIGITPAKLGLVYPLHYTGELLSAQEALRIGLVELIEDSATALADEIAGNSAHSTHQIKGFVRRILDGQADDDLETERIFADAFTTPDFIEGTSAFARKQRPEFK